MSSHIEKLAALTSKVRTPLALSGLIMTILYALYRQVLSLKVFENIGAHPTFLLLQNVLEKLFWLAIIALILGVSSYLITVVLSYRMHSHSSDVTLIDASLDPNDSPYEQSEEGGRKKIQPKK
jgi:Na+/glutamate symporter